MWPFKKREQKSYQEAYLYSLDLDLAGVSNNYQAYAREGYALNFAARRAMQLVAQASAAVPPLLYRRGKDKDEEINQHELLERLKRPNHKQGYDSWHQELVSYYKLAGDAFIRVTTETRNFELINLRPDFVEVNEDGWGDIVSYTYRGKRYTQTYQPEEIIHLKTFNPLDQNRGLSEFSSIGLELDQKNLASRWNVSILKNGGKPSYVVISKHELKEPQFARLKREIREEYSGPDSAGKIALFEGQELEIKEMSFNADDLSWLEGQKAAINAISVNLGVAPELVGVTDAKKFSNYQEAQKGLYTETVNPFLKYLFNELNNRLTIRWGKDLYLKPWFESIEVLQTNQTEIADRIEKLTKSSNITFGQAGLDLGYEVRPDLLERYQWELTYKIKWGVWPEEEKPALQAPSDDNEKWLEAANLHLKEADDLKQANQIITLALCQEFDIEHSKAKAYIQALEPKALWAASDIEAIRAL